MSRVLRGVNTPLISRLFATVLVVAIVAASCSSGSDEQNSGETTIPSLISGPASAPARQLLDEYPNPPNENAINCDEHASVIDDVVGLPDDHDHWVIARAAALEAVGDDGPHPGGWHWLSVPEPTSIRDAADPERRVARSELANLTGNPWRQQSLEGRIITMQRITEGLTSLDRSKIDSLLIPLDDNITYGGWSTTAVIFERLDGSLGVSGNCPDELTASLNEVIAAARRTGMSGPSTEILSALSITEIGQLSTGGYDE